MAQSTSPLRNGSGITTVLTVRSAPSHWWGEASSQKEMTSCAPTAEKTSEAPTAACDTHGFRRSDSPPGSTASALHRPR